MHRELERLDDVMAPLAPYSPAKVKAEADRVDTAIHSTMDRIDDTADRVRSSVRAKSNNIIGYVKGVRAAIEAMRHFRPRTESL